ncbi:MAG: glucuronyl esterase domain-containing protein, partial [Asticcacaulis sp.]
MKRAAMSGLLLALFAQMPAQAQTPPQWTDAQDHRNMMDQLHIATVRPGPSGDENAPNHANYDEAKANPYPDWPDLMTLKSGAKVTSAAQWSKRRQEIAEDLEREMYGRIPAETPKVTWTATATDHEFIAFQRVTATQLTGHADNSADPAIKADISAVLLLPDAAKGPVPVLIMFAYGPAKFPAPAQPSPEDAARINAALKAELVARDPSLAEVFARYPGYDIATTLPFPAPPSSAPDDRVVTLIRDGWGVMLVSATSYQADNGAGLTRGIIGLTNKGAPRKPDDWGALRAWGWGASRALDYLATVPQVDAKHVGIEGVSRFGKAALVTMAFDERFAFGLIGSSGEGGAKPSRRNFGEAAESLTGEGEYHWMAGNFLKYGGPKTPGDLPVDAHDLIERVGIGADARLQPLVGGSDLHARLRGQRVAHLHLA